MMTYYILISTVLTICLVLMLVDTSIKLAKSEHRTVSVVLIFGTICYVLFDLIWVLLYMAEDYRREPLVVMSVLFYLIYITLPYIWFLFAHHFASNINKNRNWMMIASIPGFINLTLVILTALGTDILWAIGDSENRYVRGPLFGVFANLNLVYYFIPVIEILILMLRKPRKKNPLLLRTFGFSVIPALSVFIHTYIISVDAVIPFQPSCFFIGVMFAYTLLITTTYKETEEQNARLTERALAAEKIAELSGSVSAMLTNMPAMTFSKDAETGRYLACNQAFADYAHLKSPEDAVGLTDAQIFDPVTAAHFVEYDQKTLSMDEPFAYSEDVTDADGLTQHLQTTKLKFVDQTGRLCIVGICIDVTDTRDKVQANSMITAMAADYRAVYYVNLDENDGVCHRGDPDDSDQIPVGVHFPYLERFTYYAKNYVTDMYRDGFLDFINPDKIRERLSTQPIIAYRFLAKRDGQEYYEMIRAAGVRRAEERDDHMVHAIGLGLTVIDTEMRDAMAKNEALVEALSLAEEANKAKTAFLSSMSHEIRTPMNAIIGLDTLALHDETISEQTREYLEKIGGSARHLLVLINDILDMSRIESGRLVLRKEEFSFSAMLEQINTMVMSQCSDKGLHYECHLLSRVDDYYIGDDMKLKEVIINILSNAVKFTDAPGSVSLSIKKTAEFEEQSTLVFCIKDTGIGMDKEYIPRIFEPFSQEDGSTKNKYGSTGLGMAITKNIVEMMNGTISVESEKGVGSEFTVTVTLRNADNREPDRESTVDINQMRVLVVDDEDIPAEHARMVLDEAGIRADTCRSGKEALRMLEVQHLKQEPYNLVLMDWKMPDQDGIDTAKEIREHYDNETTIIILTAYNWDDILEEALASGVDGFLAKPLFASNVVAEFERVARHTNMSMFKEKKRADLAGRRVLLAEDIEMNAEIIMDVLEMEEVEAAHAENGKIAVEMFENSAPDTYSAILMDIRMPEMDGLEAAAAIRALDREDAKKIPIIALTANAFDEDVQRSLQAGMNAHLSKPVEPEHLYQTLGELIYEAEETT